MNAKRQSKPGKSKNRVLLLTITMFLIGVFALVALPSCKEDPLNPAQNSSDNDDHRKTDDPIDEGAASRCDDVYAWNDNDCWEDASTPEELHQAIVCSHNALAKYYDCLKKYAHYPAGYCDCHKGCHKFAASCIGACAPGNPLQGETCLDGCVNMIGDCLVDCGLAYPYPGAE